MLTLLPSVMSCLCLQYGSSSICTGENDGLDPVVKTRVLTSGELTQADVTGATADEQMAGIDLRATKRGVPERSGESTHPCHREKLQSRIDLQSCAGIEAVSYMTASVRVCMLSGL